VLEERQSQGETVQVDPFVGHSANCGRSVTRLPIVDAKTLEQVLLTLVSQDSAAWQPCLLSPCDGRTTTLPHHPRRDLGRPLVRTILKEVNLSPEEFAHILTLL